MTKKILPYLGLGAFLIGTSLYAEPGKLTTKGRNLNPQEFGAKIEKQKVLLLLILKSLKEYKSSLTVKNQVKRRKFRLKYALLQFNRQHQE